MEGVMNWLSPIIVAAVAGGFSYLGVSKTVKASHDKILADMKAEQDKHELETKMQIAGIKEDISRLEKKQDKYNDVIHRTFVLEGKVSGLEKRVK